VWRAKNDEVVGVGQRPFIIIAEDTAELAGSWFEPAYLDSDRYAITLKCPVQAFCVAPVFLAIANKGSIAPGRLAHWASPAPVFELDC
jgi:hypothetical protein